MSDTPRTDAAKEWHDCTNKRCGEYVTADFARELERENAKLREDKARLRNAVRNMMLSLGADNPEQAKWTGESILKEIH